MRSLSETELFPLFYDKILSGDIRTFSGLKEFAASVTENFKSNPALMKGFNLIRQLYWGFFSGLNQETHSRLWKELVIPDKDFPEAGDLKRTLQISNLYICMLDIHGYTKFCMEYRKNLSMMHILDRAIENDVSRIAAKCHAISQRERGDEIVIVAGSAADAIAVTLGIIDFFGKTNILANPEIFTGRSGESSVLPVFKVSAGITGGNTTSPLIITEKGSLSGFLLNSGARLQIRANELSANESKVMIARQVEMNFLKENSPVKDSLANNKALYFFYTGHIEFKGVMIPTCEIVFYENQRYKENFSAEMIRLLTSIRENLWEQRIFCDLADLIIKAASVMPKFRVVPQIQIAEIQVFTNESVVHLAQKAVKAYNEDEDFLLAVKILNQLIEIINEIPSFDRHVYDYIIGVSDKYTMLLKPYTDSLKEQVEIKAPEIYHGNYLPAWVAAKKSIVMYEKLYEMGLNSKAITKKKSLWYSIIKQSDMNFKLYSGKK